MYHIVVSESWIDTIEGQQVLRDVLNFFTCKSCYSVSYCGFRGLD